MKTVTPHLLLTAVVLHLGSVSAATFTVTTTTDGGPGSLREAILAANASPGHDFIRFDIPLSNVVHVINLAAGLPRITEAVTIDGLTQPGSAPNSLALGFNATNLVTLHGGNIPVDPGGGGGGIGGPGDPGGPGLPGATNLIHGLEVRADFVTIRGLRFVNFLLGGSLTNNRSAIFMADVRSNVVEACVFGVDPSTSLGEPNWGGIAVTNGAHIRIGGTNVAQRNLISDNTAWQVRFINSVSNVVEGNFIGLPGLAPAAFLNQGPGIVLEGGHDNRIGGAAPGARNFLGGVGGPPPAPGGGLHDMEGAILLRRSHTNAVLGNWLGLVPPETFCRLPEGWMPCGLGVQGVSSGVVLEDAHDNLIGGPVAGEGNIIAGGGSGVRLEGEVSFNNRIQGNRIGTHPDGTAASTHALTTGVLQSSGNNYGVLLRAGARDNLVGGPAAGEGNLISNNRLHGVALLGAETTRNRVLGNLIGPDITGAEALPNGTFAAEGDGVHLAEGARGNDIGGPKPGEGNVISGNHNHGVHLTGAGTQDNRVRGNVIGPDRTGRRRLPYLAPLFPERGNVLSGVRIAGGASGNLIGGGGEGEANEISANGAFGVEIIAAPGETTTANQIAGNLIGTDLDGVTALGNALGGVRVAARGNVIGLDFAGAGNLVSGNAGPGVLLEGDENRVQRNFIGTDVGGGARVPNQQAGIEVRGARNVIGSRALNSRNVISGNTGHGVLIAGPAATGNEVFGNFIGLDAAGVAAVANTGDGVHLTRDAHDNAVGHLERGNVIAGNGGHGVAVIATPTVGQVTRNNRLLGNRIGTDAAGERARANATNGVFISGAPGSLLQANHIAGNARHGVEIEFTGDTALHGNLIGTDAAGAGPLPNDGDGVHLRNTTGVSVGDPVLADRANRIAFNAGHGVLVRAGTGNRIQGNSIHANGRLGIDLFADGDPASGVTANDPLDPDLGSNTLQNFPVLGQTTLGADTVVSGRLNSTPGQAFVIELFRSAAADPSGHGEGEVFVARQTVTTDGAGNADFQFDVPGNWTGWWFTATATVQATGDTSEFGPALLAAPPPRFVITRLDGGDFEAGFPTIHGLGYTVLSNADLGTSNWGVYANLVSTGGTNTFRVPVGSAPYLFFRLRQP
ncbi:MAG: right-handed parallel beta-helix repeat-containing protein [Verrucomicrobia bacterium]|nr:right-handed parallel beta-helix repeat-containing protein [Verrucomicrobiota bacterium]